MKIGITGATGFIGTQLCKRLGEEGHHLVYLTRNVSRAQQCLPKGTAILFDPRSPDSWWQALQGCEAVINLAGRPIADRWQGQVKQEILESRQGTTASLVAAIQRLDPKPKVLLSASAIGYYGTDENKIFDESSPPGQDFLASVCQAWERSADLAKNFGIRVVKMRFGIALGKEGGALGKLLPIFRLGLGGKVGSGTQWFSWIHRDDLVSLLLFALYNNSIAGAINATAPQAVRNTEFTEILAQVVGRPALFPVPAFALQLAFGEGAMVVLEGQRVLPKKAIEGGFTFHYPDLHAALRQILA